MWKAAEGVWELIGNVESTARGAIGKKQYPGQSHLFLFI
jgi:hypothetical protein